MGRQWNTIIESLGPLSGGTMSINANLTEIEALLTTLQADVADGIIVSSGTINSSITGGTITTGTLAQITSASSVLTGGTLTAGTITNGTVTNNPVSSTTGGTGATTATSTTFATALASNTSRKGATIFNEGAGLMHISLGTATTSTSQYSVRLSAGDYYEVPFNYTGQVGYIFATAGTARITELT